MVWSKNKNYVSTHRQYRTLYFCQNASILQTFQKSFALHFDFLWAFARPLMKSLTFEKFWRNICSGKRFVKKFNQKENFHENSHEFVTTVIANIFNTHFTSAAGKIADKIPASNRFYSASNPVTPLEVFNTTKQLQDKKSCDMNGISSYLIKKCTKLHCWTCITCI